jgi:hypothetical protein
MHSIYPAITRFSGGKGKDKSCTRLFPLVALLLIVGCAAPASASLFSDRGDDTGIPGLPSVLGTVSEKEEPAPVRAAVVEDADPLSLYAARAREAVDGVADSLASAGNGTGVTDVTAFPLITDADLADPDYLGRPMGVKVVVVCPVEGDRLQNTLWWYEKDATAIARSLYGRETKDKPGFVAVVFRKADGKATALKLVLNAADVPTDLSGKNDTYIRNIDWSAAEVGSGVSIAGYEPPGSAVQKPAGTAKGASTRTLTTDALKVEVADGTKVMSGKIDEISQAAERSDYTTVARLSDELISISRVKEKDLRSCTVPSTCAPALDEYCAGLRDYQDAGSLLWYGATFADPDAFARGNDYLVQGQTQIGSAMEKLSLSAPALETRVVAAQSLYPNALAPLARYKFKDAPEGNTISVKIGQVTRLDRYTTEKGNTVTEHVPSYGKEFLCVLVEINHLGYGGKGSQKFKTPKPSAFTLLLGGEKYLPKQPETSYIECVGSVYSDVTLNRKDRIVGYLVYEVPQSSDPALAFLQVNLGTAGGTQIWRLG